MHITHTLERVCLRSLPDLCLVNLAVKFRGKDSIALIWLSEGHDLDALSQACCRYGRVLRVNYAQPMKIKGGDKGFSHQPVWADADNWYDSQLSVPRSATATDVSVLSHWPASFCMPRL